MEFRLVCPRCWITYRVLFVVGVLAAEEASYHMTIISLSLSGLLSWEKIHEPRQGGFMLASPIDSLMSPHLTFSL
jgi:hypothetical protein